MGNHKSKESFRQAAEGGRISTRSLRKYWGSYAADERLSPARAQSFLRDVTRDAEIDIPNYELLAIVKSCAQGPCHSFEPL